VKAHGHSSDSINDRGEKHVGRDIADTREYKCGPQEHRKGTRELDWTRKCYDVHASSESSLPFGLDQTQLAQEKTKTSERRDVKDEVYYMDERSFPVPRRLYKSANDAD
jgi:hypothetical protein